jgi:lipoyl(octanoyl) transferase
VSIEVEHLGRIGYAAALQRQLEAHERVLAWRDRAEAAGGSGDGPPVPVGRVMFLEHDPPVVTVSRRPSAASNLIAPPELLAANGIEVQPTDRGGDITYHGPGQLVVYPILDLRRLGLNLHGYMRLLEDVVIQACLALGVAAARDEQATGVWVPCGAHGAAAPSAHHPGGAKVCAMGVRVRRWVTMHGLALNVRTNLDHFGLIVPCGLVGRPVTSLHAELSASGRSPTPDVAEAASAVETALRQKIDAALSMAWRAR